MKNIKLVCFDLDETLITHSSWKHLGLALGISAEEDHRMYSEYKEGKFTYDEWNNKIVQRYMSHPDSNRTEITKILSKYEYNDGVRESVEYLKSKGYVLVLISGSIDILVSMVASDLGIEYYKANNTFVFDGNDRLVGVHSNGDETIAKADQLESIASMLGINIDECACIGDGGNDIEMFNRTGNGITFKNSKIENSAKEIIESFHDLKNIL